ncbi:MAG TPA: prolyl oligopeptidase family serine peptidase [Candidatus Bathyarchaeia archaeon]|nr:prolyl oligopeptidase family serine peptidase [Candidatus Bathyarchaeia archaeon]
MLAVASSRSLRAAILALLVAAGCAPRRPPPIVVPLAPPAEQAPDNAEQRAVSLAKGWITVNLVIPRSPAGPKPAIVSPIDDDQTLLDRGIVLVRFHTNWELLRAFAQPPAHDTPTAASAPGAAAEAAGKPEAANPPQQQQNQVGTWLLAAPRPGIVGKAYFALISEDALHTLPQVMDYLETVPEIDPQRIAIAGSSTSGFVALEALAQDARFSAAVVRVACGDYHTFLRASSLALNNEARWLPDGRLELDPDYEARLQEIEPIRSADRFPPRPLLMINGAQDTAIPLDCTLHTADALRTAYARRRMPDRFRLIVYPDQGHNLGPEAATESLAWWDRWLLDRP